MYGCLLIALALLKGEMIREEAIWIGVAIFSYVISVGVGLVKFRQIPSYHTRLAKFSWLLIVVAVIAIFADWSVWVPRIAMCGVVLTNLESTAISLILPRWRPNVPSVFHARQLRDYPKKGSDPLEF
jgi:CDP-diacylglycerol--glycerol-3-phosphate 3-phosphatidyltransferase